MSDALIFSKLQSVIRTLVFNWLKSTFPILLIFVISIPVAYAQKDRHFVLENSQYIQLKSELTKRDHELIVLLPGSYNNSQDKHYPVLYFLDAYWDLPLLYSIYGQLNWDNVIPEMIMVGFSYPGKNAKYDDLRARDFTPTKVGNEHPNSGDAALFLQFIKATVIPRIESDYRVDKNERALGGSSLGGLFTLYAMYENPALFKRHIAISPAVGWDDRYMFKRDDGYAKQNKSLPARLFLSLGGDEYALFSDPIIDFQKKIEKRNYHELGLLNYTIDGERHGGVKAEGYSRGLRWVFKDIAPTGPSGLERLYQN